MVRTTQTSGWFRHRLRLSGAFVARLRPPAPARRRRAFEAPTPKPYWNVHVDEFNVEAYEHTALLYLSDDFEGGRFAMYDGDGGDRVHAPGAGDVLAFSGDASNLHRVERVASGCRFALTALFREGRNQIFDPTLMCAYATVSTRGFLWRFESFTRAIDSSQNQPHRL